MEGHNPLRPYYVPPSAGPLHPHASNASRSTQPTQSTVKPGLGSSARDILSDLDYTDYLAEASPSLTAIIKNLLDQGLWKYTSVLLAQPFEVAKTVVQVQCFDPSQRSVPLGRGRGSMSSRNMSERDALYEVPSDESDPDSPSYFTSAAPVSRPSRPRRRRFSSSGSASPPPSASKITSSTAAAAHQIPPTLHLTQVLSALWTNEGAWGVWKGTNITFIHSVLASTMTAFLRSVICAALALPDPGFGSNASPSFLLNVPPAVGGLDVLSSPYPLASLLAAVGAAGLTGLILAPIDLARTTLMLTPSTYPPKSLITALRSMDSWTVPLWLAPATLLHSTLPTLMTASTPLVLRSRLGIDPVLTPGFYGVASFLSQCVELGVRLPIETVLRRGQMAVTTADAAPSLITERRLGSQSTKPQTVVQIGQYRGLVGTMWHIVAEEGGRPATTEKAHKPATKPSTVAKGRRMRKGQGLEGLYRGWRVGIWGLVGIWSAAALGSAGKGGEF